MKARRYNMDNKTIVKEIIMLDKQIKEKKKRQEELKLIIQTQGINQLENKNIKYIQYYTVDGNIQAKNGNRQYKNTRRNF